MELEKLTDLELELLTELSNKALYVFNQASIGEDTLADEIALQAFTDGYRLALSNHDKFRLRVILMETKLSSYSITERLQGTPEELETYASEYEKLFDTTATMLGW